MALLTHADLLKTHLLADASLAGVAVQVDRKFDIREQAAETLGKKTAGAFLAISLAGWSIENPDSGPGNYWATLRYELALATHPHLLEALGLPPFDELLRRLILSIHGWQPAGMEAIYCPERWRVGSGNYVPDDTYTVYLFPATIAEDFANPLEAL